MCPPERRKTRTVVVGGVPIGGDHPVAVQSMLKTHASDVAKALEVTEKLAENGCDIIRVAVPDEESLAPLSEFCSRSPLPVVADIHFNYQLALGAIDAGFAKIRLNPGNLKDKDAIKQVVTRCAAKGLPIRIGANSGSILERSRSDERKMADALLDGVVEYCDYIESLGFHDIILSLKASDISTNTLVYRAMAERCDYPLHVGLTATGPEEEGRIKSAIALGTLLSDGIGDTIRVSLTGDPVDEVVLGLDILRATGLLFDRPEIISCPTCGRCHADLMAAVRLVKNSLKFSPRKIKVAVMGCIVNGPGEAKECDYGVACGVTNAVLFKSGLVVKSIPMSDIVPELLKLVENDDNGSC